MTTAPFVLITASLYIGDGPWPSPASPACGPACSPLAPSTWCWCATPPRPLTLVHHQARPSVADMLAKLRRVLIAAQYQPGQPKPPTITEILHVQAAWAATER